MHHCHINIESMAGFLLIINIFFFKGIWVVLLGSSSCCSKVKLVCCHKRLEEHIGMWRSIFGRRTCMASCAMWQSNDKYISACTLKDEACCNPVHELQKQKQI
eukprot:TRINITY_DN17756_c1_g1_i2.p1 TRINITY_DN17756_c1_g1~~TRINITY_DN17756_c1_g1_i2.p1  ORF type:complete len:103 (-),score=2.56 TRINITY_DN17756_c1_g1_i2:75-383(-)